MILIPANVVIKEIKAAIPIVVPVIISESIIQERNHFNMCISITETRERAAAEIKSVF